MLKKLEAHQKWVVAVLFALMVLIGLFAVQGRSIAGDERLENIILGSNIKSYVKLVGGDGAVKALGLDEMPDIDDFVERDHGQAQSYWVWPLLHAFPDSATLIYHFHIHLIFLLGLYALYRVVRRITGSWKWGLAAAGLLYVNPRFFGESFYNNKDIILLALCLVVMWLGQAFADRDDWRSCIWFGIAGAFAANTRVIGLAAFGLMGLFYIVWTTINRTWSRRAFLRGVLAVAAFLATFFLITPACWHDFFGYWAYYLGASSNFSAERWNGWVLYRGAVYNPVENPVPWHYIPWFMVITTPLLILVLALLWPVLAVLRCGKDKRKWLSFETVSGISLALLSVLPLLYAMLVRPNLYNGWRHFYFAYSPVVILAAVSACHLWQSRKKWLQVTVITALALNFVYYAGFIIRWCPQEYAYFNFLAGSHPEELYDADYWNMGCQEAILKTMEIAGPDARLIDGTPNPILKGYWYTARDEHPELFSEKAEEVSWDRRPRATHVVRNTSYWNIDLLHPSWDPEQDAAVSKWAYQLTTAPVVYEVKCGRTVLWRVYENPQYQA